MEIGKVVPFVQNICKPPGMKLREEKWISFFLFGIHSLPRKLSGSNPRFLFAIRREKT